MLRETSYFWRIHSGSWSSSHCSFSLWSSSFLSLPLLHPRVLPPSLPPPSSPTLLLPSVSSSPSSSLHQVTGDPPWSDKKVEVCSRQGKLQAPHSLPQQTGDEGHAVSLLQERMFVRHRFNSSVCLVQGPHFVCLYVRTTSLSFSVFVATRVKRKV